MSPRQTARRTRQGLIAVPAVYVYMATPINSRSELLAESPICDRISGLYEPGFNQIENLNPSAVQQVLSPFPIHRMLLVRPLV
jgi:hypothetical protein